MSTWKLHGRNPGTLLTTFASGAVHFMLAAPDAPADALAGDLAVARAAGREGCGLGPVRSGLRHALGGFFGLSAGAPAPVAIAASAGRAEALSRAIEAARLARGATGPLPIALAEARQPLADEIECAGIRLYDAAKVLDRDPRLVILAGLGGPHAAHAARIAQGQCPGAAILIIADKVLPDLLTDASAVFKVDADTITLARSSAGAWRRKFGTDRVIIDGAEALAIRPGEVLPYEPPVPVEAPASVVAPAPEPEPGARYVVLPVARRLTGEDRASWDGFNIVTAESDAVPTIEQAATEGVREIVVVRTDRDPRGARAEQMAGTIRTLALNAGTEGHIRVRVSSREIRAAAV